MAKKYQAVFPDAISRVNLGGRPQEMKPKIKSPFLGDGLIIPPSVTNFDKELIIPGSILGIIRGSRTGITGEEFAIGVAGGILATVIGGIIVVEYERWRNQPPGGPEPDEEEPAPTPPSPTPPPEDPEEPEDPPGGDDEPDPDEGEGEELYPPLDGYLIPRLEQAARGMGLNMDTRMKNIALYIMKGALLYH